MWVPVLFVTISNSHWCSFSCSGKSEYCDSRVLLFVIPSFPASCCVRASVTSLFWTLWTLEFVVGCILIIRLLLESSSRQNVTSIPVSRRLGTILRSWPLKLRAVFGHPFCFDTSSNTASLRSSIRSLAVPVHVPCFSTNSWIPEAMIEPSSANSCIYFEFCL